MEMKRPIVGLEKISNPEIEAAVKKAMGPINEQLNRITAMLESMNKRSVVPTPAETVSKNYLIRFNVTLPGEREARSVGISSSKPYESMSSKEAQALAASAVQKAYFAAYDRFPRPGELGPTTVASYFKTTRMQ